MIQESRFSRTNYFTKNPLEWNPGAVTYTYHLMLPTKVADTASQLLSSHSQALITCMFPKLEMEKVRYLYSETPLLLVSKK